MSELSPTVMANRDAVCAALYEGGDQQRIAEVFLAAAALCLRKNRDYGSSFRQAPRLAPGISPQDAVLVRIDDKDRRFANLRESEAAPGVDESLLDTMRDAANYRLLWCLLEEERIEAERAHQDGRLVVCDGLPQRRDEGFRLPVRAQDLSCGAAGGTSSPLPGERREPGDGQPDHSGLWRDEVGS